MISNNKLLYLVFIKFLKKNGVYHCFFKDVMRQKGYTNMLQIREFLFYKANMCTSFINIINHSILWRATEKGYDFYDNLNMKWIRLFNSKLRKYIDINYDDEYLR